MTTCTLVFSRKEFLWAVLNTKAIAKQLSFVYHNVRCHVLIKAFVSYYIYQKDHTDVAAPSQRLH